MEIDEESVEYLEMQEDLAGYSNPYENYCRLQQTAVFIQNDGRITEDWMEEHKKHILKYFEIFPRLSEVNEEIEDSTFRKKAKEAETLLLCLVDSIQKSGTFNVKFYRMLNENMVYLSETMFSDDELAQCMEMLKF